MNKIFYRFLSGRRGASFEIRILMRQTARAFGVKTPKTAELSPSELLENYARFTADASTRALKSGKDPALLHQNLYNMAYRLGGGVRRLLAPQDGTECLAILILLYRNIGITISEDRPEEFCVYSCYFSAFYTPEICSVIAAVDAGIFAGIFKGGTLAFQERITEGYETCLADFR